MTLLNPHLDPCRFQRLFEDFRAFVQEKSGTRFVSFASNLYTEDQEGYKYRIFDSGRDALGFRNWRSSSIGDGTIAESVIAAIELPDNNLVPWRARFGPQSRPQRVLYECRTHPDKLPDIERVFFDFYTKDQDETSFGDLTAVFGRTYPLLAYFFFLKDRSRYLPIAPTSFDRAFEYLGADFKTSQRCSWDNYSTFLRLMGELKAMLADSIGGEVTLLDAHSFAWILVSQMEKADRLAYANEYARLSGTERHAIMMARVGQGRFRQSLLEYWAACAVTGCREPALLRASHIKPWADSAPRERLDPFNGLLLSPDVDSCFDSGLVTFDYQGQIVISPRLHAADADTIGITPDMRLRRLAEEHKKYLAFHREHVFKG
jgi:hypothetical protein